MAHTIFHKRPFVRRIEDEEVIIPENYAAGWTAGRIINLVLDVLEGLLGFRFILRALSANSANGFVNFIYSISDPLVAPFRGIFRTTVSNGSVLEWHSILAMIVYAFVGYIIIRLIRSTAAPSY